MYDFNERPMSKTDILNILSSICGEEEDISKDLRKNLKTGGEISQLAEKLMICLQYYSHTITEEQAYEVIRVLEKDYSLGWKNGIYQNANPCIKSQTENSCLYNLSRKNLRIWPSLYNQLKGTKKLLENYNRYNYAVFLI